MDGKSVCQTIEDEYEEKYGVLSINEAKDLKRSTAQINVVTGRAGLFVVLLICLLSFTIYLKPTLYEASTLEYILTNKY
jgi:hypothetical protein